MLLILNRQQQLTSEIKMKTQQVELFIQATKYCWEEEFNIEVNTVEHKTETNSARPTTYVTLDKKTVSVTTPEIDEKMLTLAYVEQIRQQIKAEKAASYLRVTQMEDQINSLMCIENKE